MPVQIGTAFASAPDMPRHAFTPARREALLAETLARTARGHDDNGEARRTLDGMSRMFGAQDAHREQAERRAAQNHAFIRDHAESETLRGALDKQPHAWRAA